MSDQTAHLEPARRARGELKSSLKTYRFAAISFLLLVALPYIELLVLTHVVTLDTYMLEEGGLPPYYNSAGDLCEWFFKSWGVYFAVGLVISATMFHRITHPAAQNRFAISFMIFELVWAILFGYALFIAAHSYT